MLVPAMILVFDMPQRSAQGVSLAVMVPIVLVGAICYKLNPNVSVNTRAVLFLAVAGAIGAIGGAWIASVVPALILRRLFAALLILTALKLMFMTPSEPKTTKPLTVNETLTTAEVDNVVE